MEKAVAIVYKKDLPAPFVLAKGRGHLAKKIIELAEKAGVAVIPESELTERLFLLETCSFIPEDCFEIVAEMLVFVHNVKKRGLSFYE